MPSTTRRRGDPEPYFQRPDSDECWEWDGSRTNLGYGRIDIDGRTFLAHRLVYERRVGPIPAGLQLDHLCRNPGCVNPAHLEPVTSRENRLRGATPYGPLHLVCRNGGHDVSDPSAWYVWNGGRSRTCLACKRDNDRRAEAKRGPRPSARIAEVSS